MHQPAGVQRMKRITSQVINRMAMLGCRGMQGV